MYNWLGISPTVFNLIAEQQTCATFMEITHMISVTIIRMDGCHILVQHTLSSQQEPVPRKVKKNYVVNRMNNIIVTR